MEPTTHARWPFLLLALGLVAVAGVFMAFRLTTPADGARLMPGKNVWRPDGVVVTPLMEEPGGLRDGDLVVAVDGRSMEEWARALVRFETPRAQWQTGQIVTYTVLREGTRLAVPVTLKPQPVLAPLVASWSGLLFVFTIQVIATFVLIRRPAEPAARALFIFAWSLWHFPVWLNGLQVSDLVNQTGFWLYKANTFAQFLLTFTALLHFSLVFPKLHPLAVKHRRIFLAVYAAPYALYLIYLLVTRLTTPTHLDWLGRWAPGEWLVTMICVAMSVAVGVQGYRAGYDAVARRKVRWVVLAGIVTASGLLVLWLLPGALLGQPLISPALLGLFGLPLALSLAIAILRHHLFDIDIIINRTLVYGTLTVSTVALYVFIVGYLGSLFHAVDRSVIAFLTTGLVAVIFQPLRERLQRAINRLMYGERDDPYIVLSRLGQRLEAALAPEAGLQTMVETVAQALKLPHVAIALQEVGELRIAASCGPPVSNPLVLPLSYQAETIGQLICAPRAAGETFTPAEQRLLEDVAHQAGPVAYSVRLTAELQRSRERLVTAREEERRRLRRDLHDGLGPALASQGLKLAAVQQMLSQGPAAVDAMLEELMEQNAQMVGDIRRLVYALRPPALDELGLVEAIRDHARSLHSDQAQPGRLHITVEAPPAGLPPLPAAVEVAAYRIALEALTNVARHARARQCTVRLSLSGADGSDQPPTLQLEVTDDGVGLAPTARAGVGLTSMRERAEELGGTCVVERRAGGGTRVVARLPPSRET